MNRLLIWICLGGLALAQTPPSQQAATSAAQPAQPAVQQEGVSPDLLPKLPAVASGKTSLIGGTITRLDRVRDEMTLKPFGSSNSMRVAFDGRTRIVRDGQKASDSDLKTGQRVYLDTILDGTRVFARSIRFQAEAPTGEITGQVSSVSGGELRIHDALSATPIVLHLSADTVVLRDEQTVPASEMRPGSLVSINFQPAGKGQGIARQISILAVPGTVFTFAGRVIHLDLHSGMLVIVDPRDKKTYEVHIDPVTTHVKGDLQEDSDVTATAKFDGSRYSATDIAVNPTIDQPADK